MVISSTSIEFIGIICGLVLVGILVTILTVTIILRFIDSNYNKKFEDTQTARKGAHLIYTIFGWILFIVTTYFILNSITTPIIDETIQIKEIEFGQSVIITSIDDINYSFYNTENGLAISPGDVIQAKTTEKLFFEGDKMIMSFSPVLGLEEPMNQGGV